MAYDRGYIKITRETPPQNLLDALENYVGREKFRDLRTASSQKMGSLRVNGGNASKELLYHGVDDFRNVSWFQDVLGCSFDDTTKSDPQVLFWVKNEIRLPRYPAGPPSTAYIYCPATTEDLHEDNGFFRIVEGSHRMTRAEIDRAGATTIRIKPNEILIMYADVTIEYPQTGGGVGVWMKVSRPPG